MRIVTKTFRDLVPKVIMFLMINDTKSFIFGELLANLYAAGDQASMMEESPEEERRREELLKMYHACKEALRIIGDVSMATVYSPAPPPVKSDWAGIGRPSTASPTPPSPTPPAGRPAPPGPHPGRSAPPPPGPPRGAPAPPPPGRVPPGPPGRGPPPPVGARPGGQGLPPPLIPQRGGMSVNIQGPGGISASVPIPDSVKKAAANAVTNQIKSQMFDAFGKK